MNRGLYTAASSLYSSQQWLESVAHNLANASTTGYKRDTVAFEESLVRELRADGGRGRVIGDIQSGPQIVGVTTSFDHGSLLATGNALDVALTDTAGMFAVETPGGVRYTRAGNFTLNSQRQLVNPNGYPVLDDNRQAIVADRPGTVSIGPDGSVTVGDAVVAKLGIFKGQFSKTGQALFQATAPTETLENPTLAIGSLEASNVNVIATMIEMVKVQRLFEMAQKSMQSHDETTSQLIKSSSQQ